MTFLSKVCPLDYADDLKFWGINESFMEFCCQVKRNSKARATYVEETDQVGSRFTFFGCRISSCREGRRSWEKWQRTTKSLRKRRFQFLRYSTLHILDFWIYPNVYLNTQYLTSITISEKGLFCLAKTYHNIHIYVLTLIIRKTILERGLLSLTRKHSGICLKSPKEEWRQR